MATRNYLVRIMVAFLGIGLLCITLSTNAFAHCDTLDGPVVQMARTALEKGDVTPLLQMGAGNDDEKEIQDRLSKRRWQFVPKVQRLKN